MIQLRTRLSCRLVGSELAILIHSPRYSETLRSARLAVMAGVLRR